MFICHCYTILFLCCRNFQVFNQQLWELWQQELLLKSAPGPAGDMVKVGVKVLDF